MYRIKGVILYSPPGPSFLGLEDSGSGSTGSTLSVKTISKWENGNYMPPVDVLMLLSEMYNVSINEILTGQIAQNENKSFFFDD